MLGLAAAPEIATEVASEMPFLPPYSNGRSLAILPLQFFPARQIQSHVDDMQRLLGYVPRLLFQIVHINIILQIEISKPVSALLARLFVPGNAQISPHHTVAPVVMERESIRVN